MGWVLFIDPKNVNPAGVKSGHSCGILYRPKK